MSKACKQVAPAVLLAGVVLVLYWPVLQMALIGDDYQWLQHARAAVRKPASLLADLDTFYRPASTWTLVVDDLIWRGQPTGFRCTNLLLHACCAWLLALVGRRLGLSLAAAGTVAVLWAASPFASEPASQVAIRFENLLLLAWLGLVLVWPRELWTPRSRAGVAGLTVAAMLAKETWVVTPALAWVLERTWRRRTVRTAVWTTLPFVGLAGLYTTVYFRLFPGDKGYFQVSLRTLAKLPHQLAAFLYLEDLVPLGFPFSWRNLLALIVILGLAARAVRSRSATGIVGLTLLVVPALPTLFVPFLPTRHTSVPYAGFLLLVAGALDDWMPRWTGSWRRLVMTATGVLAALVLAAGAVTVRADLSDIGRVAAAHARLLEEARTVAAEFPRKVPVVHVRAEHENLLAAIAATPRGLHKLYYPRHEDPYDLIDIAALFDYLLEKQGVEVRILRDDDPRLAGPGVVLTHRLGGFTWQQTGAPVGGVLGIARARGWPARALIATPVR